MIGNKLPIFDRSLRQTSGRTIVGLALICIVATGFLESQIPANAGGTAAGGTPTTAAAPTTSTSKTNLISTAASLTSTMDHNGIVVANLPVVLQGIVTAASSLKTQSSPTGTVTVLINGLSIDNAPSAPVMSDGSFSLPYFTLLTSKAPYQISVHYSGDKIYAPTISRSKAITAVDSNTVTTISRGQEVTTPFGATLKFQAHISSIKGYDSIPTGWVQFTLDGIFNSGAMPLDSHGNSAWIGEMGSGKHTLLATYVADQSANKMGLSTSNATISQVVNPPTNLVTAVLTESIPVTGANAGLHIGVGPQLPTGIPKKFVVPNFGFLKIAPKTPVTFAASATSSGKDPLPWVVALGDSSMAGEGGRWAGNSNDSSSLVDALGGNAYSDNIRDSLPSPPGIPATGTYELIPGCHRSQSDEAFIGGPVWGLDLACSGAQTYTHIDSSGSSHLYKPGIDNGNYGGTQYIPPAAVNQQTVGQDTDLEALAYNHDVKMIVLGIGVNNFNFADLLQTCLTDYMISPDLSLTWFHLFAIPQFPYFKFVFSSSDLRKYCSDDSNLVAKFNGVNATIDGQITQAIESVATQMASLNYTRNDYKIIVQTYPDVIANSTQMRYPQGANNLSSLLLVDKQRQTIGGCGFWNKDVDWMMGPALQSVNSTVEHAMATASTVTVSTPGWSGSSVTYLPNIQLMDVTNAFQNHLLCENTDSLVSSPNTWQTSNAVNSAEWVNQIRLGVGVLGALGWSYLLPYSLQESAHPNYWGQLAFRSCVRMAYNQLSSSTTTMNCVPSGGGGLNTQSPPEPNMAPF